AGFALLPFFMNFRRHGLVATPWTIWRSLSLSRIFALVIQQGIRERTQHRLGMLPSDVLKRTPTICYVNRFVADITEITRPIAAKNFKQFLCASRTDQARDSRIGGCFVPIVHGLGECLPGL